jgi:hypothetical protein
MKKIYNGSVVYHKQYDQTTQALKGLRDLAVETYQIKAKLIGLNKDGLTELTNIAFEARKDAPGLAWKWTVENQPLPFNQFSDFYKELSTFVESKRAEYYALEVQRQNIAKAHNTLIDTFPNNIYNWFLGRSPINYKYEDLPDGKVFQ